MRCVGASVSDVFTWPPAASGSTMFNYDWFNDSPYANQIDEAKFRCTMNHFPDSDPEEWEKNKKIKKFRSELLVRTLIYLRDGFSYEVKEFADVPSKSHLCFECMPVDDQYKVGAFVVTVPFDELVRIEAFAVHPDEKPDDLPQITGFRAHHPSDQGLEEARPPGGK